jgi:C4-dicarboxylate-specific signal transduction histidine kinase
MAESWDRKSLLDGAIADVLAHLPVRALLLRAGPTMEQYGEPQLVSAERLCLGCDEGELWVTLSESMPEPERSQLYDLLKAHFEACLSIAGRWGLAHEEVLKARKVLEDSQTQILHASKMAAVGQLAAGVAHELNSPLGAVMLQLDAASLNLERHRYEKAAEKLASAEKAAATAKEIISKLLFYSRDASKGLRDVNLNDVVDDTLALLGMQLSYDNLDLVITLGDLPIIKANQNELQQVVTNLLLNAKDAVLDPMAKAKLVEVVTFCKNGEVTLEVRDAGPGIAEGALAKIFDPFFTTKPAGRGTGLGLSVSLKIMEQHGGRLTAANHPEGGARFQMTLPVSSELPDGQSLPGPATPTP